MGWRNWTRYVKIYLKINSWEDVPSCNFLHLLLSQRNYHFYSINLLYFVAYWLDLIMFVAL